MKKIQATKLTKMALLTAVAVMIHALEALLPALVPVPGIKPGLANIVTLLALYWFRPVDALWIVAARLLIGSAFGGSLSSLMYAAAGSALSLAVMLPLRRALSPRYMHLISILGAVGHNLGQIALAVIITKTTALFAYLPFLMLSACVTGLLTGLSARAVYLRLEKK